MSQQLEYLNQDNVFISPIPPKVKSVIFRLTFVFIADIFNFLKLLSSFMTTLRELFKKSKSKSKEKFNEAIDVELNRFN